MAGTGRDQFNPVADNVAFDDTQCQLNVDTTQEALDALCNRVAISASPGFTWGSSGNVTSNTWLLNDSVPSNKTGRLVSLNSTTLAQVATSAELSATYDLEIYEHDGTTYTLLTTINVVAQRSVVFDTGDFGTVNITTGKELAIKLVNGSAKNIVVGLILQGSVV